MTEQILWEKHWSNSLGEENGWAFNRCGNEVQWSYCALFDASTNEYSHGEATFTLEGFKQLLNDYLQHGEATLEDETGQLGIYLTKDRLLVRAFPDGISYPHDGVPPEILALINAD